MRERYREELRTLTTALAELGERCERGIEAATAALLEADREAGENAVLLERETDRLEDEVERLCLRLLMTQQPVASDLRLISAAMKMSTDMERIGDQAADIAELTASIPAAALPVQEDEALRLPLAEMAELCSSMLRDAIAAYDLRDVDLTRQVIGRDDAVDAAFDKAKAAIAARLCGSDGRARDCTLDLFLCAKYYERIGDHAQNIAEWVEYALCGFYRGREL